MLISSNNLFPDASVSRGDGSVRKLLSDFKNGENLVSFENFLKNSTDVQQISQDNVKKESEESLNDLDSLFSRVDCGVETGIRLSLPDFIKNKNYGGLNAPEAFVSAEINNESPSGFNDPQASTEVGNIFAFAVSTGSGEEKENLLSQNAETLPEEEYCQYKDKKNDSAYLISPNKSGEIKDKPEVAVDLSSFIESQLIGNIPLKSAVLKRIDTPVTDSVSKVSGDIKNKSVNDDGVSLNVLSEGASDLGLRIMESDPEVISLQATNSVLAGSDRTQKNDHPEALGKTEDNFSVEPAMSNEMQAHLRDGVPLVENPSFPEVIEQNPDVGTFEVVQQIENMPETSLQAVSGAEIKPPSAGSSGNQEMVSKNKTSEISGGDVNISNSSRFTDGLSDENIASAFTDGSDGNRREEAHRSGEAKEVSLNENLFYSPDSDILRRNQESKGILQTIPLQKGPEALSDGVANVVKFINSRGETKAQVIVDPPAIGKVQIEIHATPDGMEANLRVDNAAVRDMMKAQLPLLQDMLAQQGISLSEMNVDVHSGDGSKRQWVDKNANRRRSEGKNEDTELEFTARIDLEQGLLVWTA